MKKEDILGFLYIIDFFSVVAFVLSLLMLFTFALKPYEGSGWNHECCYENCGKQAEKEYSSNIWGLAIYAPGKNCFVNGRAETMYETKGTGHFEHNTYLTPTDKGFEVDKKWEWKDTGTKKESSGIYIATDIEGYYCEEHAAAGKKAVITAGVFAVLTNILFLGPIAAILLTVHLSKDDSKKSADGKKSQDGQNDALLGFVFLSAIVFGVILLIKWLFS